MDFCKDCKHYTDKCSVGLKPYFSKISKCEVCGWKEQKSPFAGMKVKHTDGGRY